MAYSGVRELIVENRHTGERLAMRRVKRGDEVWLELKGSLPPHQQGPPLHIHVAEDEEGVVKSGTLSAQLNGRRFAAGVALLNRRPVRTARSRRRHTSDRRRGAVRPHWSRFVAVARSPIASAARATPCTAIGRPGVRRSVSSKCFRASAGRFMASSIAPYSSWAGMIG